MGNDFPPAKEQKSQPDTRTSVRSIYLSKELQGNDDDPFHASLGWKQLVSVTQSVVVGNGALISLEESSPGKHAQGGGGGISET